MEGFFLFFVRFFFVSACVRVWCVCVHAHAPMEIVCDCNGPDLLPPHTIFNENSHTQTHTIAPHNIIISLEIVRANDIDVIF